MTEAVVLEGMMVAGMEALSECRMKGMTDSDTCVEVYIAMEGARIRIENEGMETVH